MRWKRASTFLIFDCTQEDPNSRDFIYVSHLWLHTRGPSTICNPSVTIICILLSFISLSILVNFLGGWPKEEKIRKLHLGQLKLKKTEKQGPDNDLDEVGVGRIPFSDLHCWFFTWTDIRWFSTGMNQLGEMTTEGVLSFCWFENLW